jgi:hypothetical protein
VPAGRLGKAEEPELGLAVSAILFSVDPTTRPLLNSLNQLVVIELKRTEFGLVLPTHPEK